MTALTIVALVVAAVADVVTTRRALDAGATEANPILRAAGPGWVWLRVALTVAAIVVVAKNPGLWLVGLAVAAGWGYVAWRNYQNARALK